MCLAMLFSCQRTNRRLFAYQGSQWLMELDRQIILIVPHAPTLFLDTWGGIIVKSAQN